MDLDVVIGRDGTLTIFTRTGTFQDGQAEIAALLAQLTGAGIPISLNGDVEQHRHGPEEQRQQCPEYERQ